MILLQFFTGWWLIIDVQAAYPQAEQFNKAYHVCGVFGTISLFMWVSVTIRIRHNYENIQWVFCECRYRWKSAMSVHTGITQVCFLAVLSSKLTVQLRLPFGTISEKINLCCKEVQNVLKLDTVKFCFEGTVYLKII